MSESRQAKKFVQQIVVQPGTHEDTVAAVAKASAFAVGRRFDSDVYRAWWAGSFTKTVRRTKAAGFERLLPGARAVCKIGSARAAAFDPSAELSKELSRLQVAGLECERTGAWIAEGGPVVVINTGVVMSTGKTAAQAAHALGLWLTTVDPDVRAEWLANPEFTMVEESFARHGTPDLVVRDNGLTEIEPGTATAGVRL